MRRTPLRKDKRQMADNTTPSFRVISFPVSLKVVARADVWWWNERRRGEDADPKKNPRDHLIFISTPTDLLMTAANAVV